MRKRSAKKYKNISIFFLIVLVLELLYVGYRVLYHGKESIYFEGINELVVTRDYLISVGSNNNNNNHFEKAKISKYNFNKEKIFERLYSVGYNSSYFGVVDDNTNFVVVGSYEKDKDDHEYSTRRGLIVKYDSEGNVIFKKDYKLLDNTKFTSINVLDDGYLVAGQSVYKNTHIGDNDGGAILIKYNKNGDVVWSKTYGNSRSAIYNKTIIVGNYIYAAGINDNNTAIICKYDFDGNMVEYNDYKYTDLLGFRDLMFADGKIYVVGASRKTVTDTDAMIVKYDLDCKYEGQVVYDGKGLDRFNRIIKDDQNNLIVIGTVAKEGKTSQKSIDKYNYDGVIAKYNADLKEISIVTYGDEMDDYFTDIKIIKDKYLVSAYSSYEDGSYMSKFITYSDALKVLGVE